MTNKKLLWIIIPLSILIVSFIAIKLVTPSVIEIINDYHGHSKIQNAKYTTDKLKELRHHLDNGEIEKAQTLIDLLFEVERTHLESTLDSKSASESVSRHAKRVLAKIESGSDQPTPRKELQGEKSN